MVKTVEYIPAIIRARVWGKLNLLASRVMIVTTMRMLYIELKGSTGADIWVILYFHIA